MGFNIQTGILRNIKRMVNFYLATSRRERSAIYLSITFGGVQYRRTTKESTLVKFWNPKTQRVRVCRENRAANRTNEALDQWQQAASKVQQIFKQAHRKPTSQELFAEVDRLFYADDVIFVREPEARSDRIEGEDVPGFTEYMLRYIARYEQVRSEITVKHYRTTLNKLRAFEQRVHRRLRFSDITIDFYNRFRIWVYDQGYSDNYFGSLIKVIKQVYREARDVDRLHDLTGTAHKGFITVAKESDPIFLTVEELLRLHRLVLTEELVRAEWPELGDAREVQRRIATCELVRNRFLIGAFSGLRVSDFSQLNERNIVGDLIMLRTRKTDTPIAVPVHPVIRKILDDGFDLNKTISDQKMNTYIKHLAKMARIDGKVAIREYRGGEPRVRCTEKYNLVSTHTARRSFATNLLKAKDVPLSAISKALGHSKITTTMRYLRVGVEENASILAGSRYFSELAERETED